ncbi:MAG: helix-turn-helix domain-containing protein [Minwuiales bacterium]|nr:helix-turn-helix domain-containing protein [Minwuiales bacterium]
MAQQKFTEMVIGRDMENQLRIARKARRLTQHQLAERADTTVQQISRLERGERRMTLDWVRRLARAMGCTEAEVLGAALSTVEPVTVRGAVEAGAWRTQADWPVEDRYPASVPEDPRYAGVPRFGLEVRGTALNRRYPEGSILICVAVGDLDGTPEAGKRLICHRRDENGRVEVTARLLRHQDGGGDGPAWLWLDSDDPKHQQPIPADEAEIVALVTGSYTPE